MDAFKEPPDKVCHSDGWDSVAPGSTDIKVQLVISLALGVTAFFTFCILRPRWPSLYAARKRHLDPTIGIPSLPKTFFGWIPVLYRITDQQLLASAGLDAFVFLAFFKLAIKLFGTMFLFAAVVLAPINSVFVPSGRFNESDPDVSSSIWMPRGHARDLWADDTAFAKPGDDNSWNSDMGYLWSYLIFTYFFTGLTFYFMNGETHKVIRVRQDYLGGQSTITDRTFRLSRIPIELRSEEKIKELVEKLEIGLVDSVSLCREWEELDSLMAQRNVTLRRLEAAWSDFLGHQPLRDTEREAHDRAVIASNEAIDEEAGEQSRLLTGDDTNNRYPERDRPQTRIRYGFLRIRSRKIDALDYYDEKLRRLDDKIQAARKKNYDPTDVAFVTMDSTAACQMAIQAMIDPHPGQLLTKPAPAPSDIVWAETYSTRWSRQVRGWAIMSFVGVLTIVWLLPVAGIASILSLCTLGKVFPSLAETLKNHEIAKALVQTGLSTGVVSLLNIAVPYLYDFLSYYQGMPSQSDIALSVVSKNFFFTFFNIFLVFTVFGTVSGILPAILDSLSDTVSIARTLAQEIQRLSVFYLNFIMLQGIGLFPFRLLEFGSVSLYPIYRFMAKTPRDYSEMKQPPIFSYGFYLPTALLVFILCLVYSVLPRGYLVLFLGLVYFTLGYFTYKYQLIYAMDQPQHATGGAWIMICYRIFLGLVVFQFTMGGLLALRSAFTAAVLVVPLVLGTVWYSYAFRTRFEPLTKFISLRSIKSSQLNNDSAVIDPDDEEDDQQQRRRTQNNLRRRSTIDEEREQGAVFVNPSLVVPLQQPWIYRDPPPPLGQDELNGRSGEGSLAGTPTPSEPSGNGNGSTGGSNTSSVSLGDTHIWRDE